MTFLELLLLCTLIIVVSLLILSSSLIGRNEREPPNLPPGKLRGLPFLGETLRFFEPHLSSNLGSYIEDNIRRYGKIFRMNLLGGPTIVSVDSNFNAFVLKNEGKLFISCPPTSVMEILGKKSLIGMSGEMRHKVRSIILSFFNDKKLKTQFMPEIDRQATRFLDSWKHNSSLLALDAARKFSFDVIVKHLLGLEAGSIESEKIRKEYRTFMRGMVSVPLNIPGTSFYRALQSRSAILGIFSECMDRQIDVVRMKNKDDSVQGDNSFMSVMIEQKQLSREVMLDTLLGALFAGHETVSTGIALAIYFLSSCPQAIQQLREEHRVITNPKKDNEEMARTKLDWDSYKEMVFTQSVVKETLRLGNIIKLVYRKAIQDVQYEGFNIPCGWKIAPILSSGHLDPNIYDNPQAFNPWRWMDTNLEPMAKRNLMPFGGGPRLCLGEDLAKVQLAIFIQHLVSRYDWEMVEPDIPMCYSFLEFPKGLPIKVLPIQISY